MNSKKSIIITTINPPSEGIKKIARLCPDWNFIVVGDKKTPANWNWPGTQFLSFSDQQEIEGRLARLCPPNHYARKNIGYLAAMQQGASIIAETDDDNIPYDGFLKPVERTVVARPVLTQGWENIYRHFGDERIWPRGLPLEEINSSLRSKDQLGDESSFRCPVQQFLADGDPDVDAIYRLTAEGEIKFRSGAVVLRAGTYCPFNSQNTVWWPEVYSLLYLPAYVSFRMTDIWRSFVAQICLYRAGMMLVFRGPTVFQARNDHNLMRDFSDEVPGYLHNAKIMRLLESLDLSAKADEMGNNLLHCYEALIKAAIVSAQELPLVEAWLEDVSRFAQLSP